MTTTPQAVRRASPRTRRTVTPPDPARSLLPDAEPVRLLARTARRCPPRADYPEPPAEALRELYRRMVLGRRFDTQATALTKQGRLAVYPSSRGQEACQVGAVLALREHDWVFPTYRDVDGAGRPRHRPGRGADPAARRLALRLRPAQHRSRRSAPRWPPALHAVGLAHARGSGRDTVALAFVGDGATSEGDFHEALNFAAVWQAPVVFLVQNNGFAISVPLAKQTAAPSLAHKGVGYGMPSELVDGNDAAAVLAVLDRGGRARPRPAAGPTLVEAHHLPDGGAHQRRRRHPLPRRRRGRGLARPRPDRPAGDVPARTAALLDDAAVAEVADGGRGVRRRPARPGMNADPALDPLSCSPTSTPSRPPHCVEQREPAAAPSWPPRPTRTTEG